MAANRLNVTSRMLYIPITRIASIRWAVQSHNPSYRRAAMVSIACVIAITKYCSSNHICHTYPIASHSSSDLISYAKPIASTKSSDLITYASPIASTSRSDPIFITHTFFESSSRKKLLFGDILVMNTYPWSQQSV